MTNALSHSIRILSRNEILDQVSSRPLDHAAGYLAMYSSWFGGIITDPSFMMIPIDDHVVHRGDGIFEAIKFFQGQVYALDPHLDRLWRSSEFVFMKMPCSKSEMKDIILATIRAAKVKSGLIRLYVTRGPGGFTTNPYESIGSQLYIIITTLKPMSDSKMKNGLSVMLSKIPVKEGFFANVKSCNYLPNVLMKKEAVDHGVDFTVSIDEKEFVAEGSTENFFMLSAEGDLLLPELRRILRGVTMMRVAELASSLVGSGLIRGIRHAGFKVDEVHKAKEAYMAGTTMDIMPVTIVDGKPIGDGKPGPVFLELHRLLQQDLANGPELTAIF